MISWILNNIGTIAVTAILIAIVITALVIVLKDKKKGKSTCGCNCAHCAMAGSCHNSKR